MLAAHPRFATPIPGWHDAAQKNAAQLGATFTSEQLAVAELLFADCIAAGPQRWPGT